MALRLAFGLVRTPLQELDVVIEGSVAHALSRRGRRLSVFLGLGDDSLRGTISGEYLAVAIPDPRYQVIMTACRFQERLLSCNGGGFAM